MRLVEILFPYRVRQTFGAASLALVFLVLLLEVEALVFLALAVVAHRLPLFWDLQPILLPGACLVSLSAAVVFTWRARSWTKRRIAALDAWAGSGTSFAQTLARKRTS